MLFYQLKKQNIYKTQSENNKALIKILFKIAIAIVGMIVVILLINPADSWWQESGIWLKVGRLLLLVLASIIAYFGTLYLVGVRRKQLFN